MVQSLCKGINAEVRISFKSGVSVADSRQLKTMHQLFIKKRFYCTTFWSACVFFLWDFFHANKILKKSNIAQSVIKPITDK